MPASSVDYLCIGHFCHDLHEEAYLLGGTASYSSLLAQSMGYATAVLTSTGDDFAFSHQFQAAGIQVCNKPAPHTTVFKNHYSNGQRVQTIYRRAHTLYATDLPPDWQYPTLVLFCPIANEVDFSLLQRFPKSLKGACLQGWLRQWDEQGRISPKSMDWEQLKHLDVVIMSEEDIRDNEAFIPPIIDLVAVVIITQGSKGAKVFHHQQELRFPAYPVEEVDPTGAGDVFAFAFLVHYSTHRIASLAIAYAHSAASIAVERLGVSLVKKEAIEERYGVYIQRYL